jgi:anti-sigma-K factor RskA
MTSKELKGSGLLELYALGTISDANKKIVEDLISKDKSLFQELKEIEQALELYAQSKGIKPSDELRNKVIQNIKANGVKSKSINVTEGKSINNGIFNGTICKILGALLAAALVFGFFQLTQKNNFKNQLEKANITKDSILSQLQEDQQILQEISEPENVYIAFTPTEKFESTEIVLLTNAETETNYLKVENLPEINDGQAFQLWSLKESGDPVPLNVFNPAEGEIIELDYENGTVTYAITIEDENGAITPNLDNLIATANI